MNPLTTPCSGNPRFVADPIDVVTGANVDVVTDLLERGPILLRWRRHYNSARAGQLGSLGWGHAHGFDCRLVKDLDGLHYEDPAGGVVGFKDLKIGGSDAAGGLALTRATSDVFHLEQDGEPLRVFRFVSNASAAHLEQLVHRGHTIEFRYGDRGALEAILDARGRFIRVASDPAGRIMRLVLDDGNGAASGGTLLEYVYDDAGNLIRATDRNHTTLSFAYDSANRMTRRTDRRGYSFTFRYDEQGRCIHSRGEDGLLEVFLDFHPEARTTIVRRGDGGQWVYNYDANQVITQVIDPYGHATQFITDELGRPIQEVDPNGNVSILHYDWRGRHDYRMDPHGYRLPTREADPNPPDPLEYFLPTTSVEWDLGLRIDAKTIRRPQWIDAVLSQFPAPVVNTVLGRTDTYDGTVAASSPSPSAAPRAVDLMEAFGQALDEASPRFRENWNYDPNGNLVEHRDRDGMVSRFTYESWNSLKESIDPIGHVTSFAITVQGLVAKVTDAGGSVTEYEYDLREKLVQVREHGGFVEQYRRDPAGNVVEKLDSTGQIQARWEIGAGNLARAVLLGSGEKHLFDYDDKGRLVKTETPAGTATFAYDAFGNRVADQRDGKGVVHEFDFTSLVRTTYFDRFQVRYRTAENGEVTIEDPTGAAHVFQFTPSGLVLKRLANGSRELCQYDSEGRCRRKALVYGSGGGGDALWMHGYGYSGTGDLVAAADTHHGSTRYRHDAAHRIAEQTAADGVTLHFEHDAAGNLLRQPGLAGVVIGPANRLQEANGDLCTYSPRGHLAVRASASATTRYTYDDLDMLIRCDLDGEPWTASYDGLCRRVQKVWRGESRTYYWDDFRLAAEVHSSGSLRLYIYADHKALAPFLFIDYDRIDAEPESGRRYYVFTNQIAAPIRVDDDAGRTVWSASIGPYGVTRIDPASTVEMPLRFPGHYFDPETRLHYNRNRYYSPELGRYLQSDPAGLAGGINAYGYRSRPLTTVDIDGLGKARHHNPDKNPPAHQVGCPVLAADIDPNKDVRKQLQDKANALQDQIDAARKAGHEFIRLPNGQVIDVKNKDHIGPCITVAYDTKTGKTYYGQNMDNQLQTGLHEPLQSRADNLATKNMEKNYDRGGKPPSLQGDIPGTHSEIQAVSAGMHDRDKQRASDPSTPHPPEVKDFVVYNQSTKDRSAMPCCKSHRSGCQDILGTNDPVNGAKDVS